MRTGSDATLAGRTRSRGLLRNHSQHHFRRRVDRRAVGVGHVRYFDGELAGSYIAGNLDAASRDINGSGESLGCDHAEVELAVADMAGDERAGKQRLASCRIVRRVGQHPKRRRRSVHVDLQRSERASILKADGKPWTEITARRVRDPDRQSERHQRVARADPQVTVHVALVHRTGVRPSDRVKQDRHRVACRALSVGVCIAASGHAAVGRTGAAGATRVASLDAKPQEAVTAACLLAVRRASVTGIAVGVVALLDAVENETITAARHLARDEAVVLAAGIAVIAFLATARNEAVAAARNGAGRCTGIVLVAVAVVALFDFAVDVAVAATRGNAVRNARIIVEPVSVVALLAFGDDAVAAGG